MDVVRVCVGKEFGIVAGGSEWSLDGVVVLWSRRLRLREVAWYEVK